MLQNIKFILHSAFYKYLFIYIFVLSIYVLWVASRIITDVIYIFVERKHTLCHSKSILKFRFIEGSANSTCNIRRFLPYILAVFGGSVKNNFKWFIHYLQEIKHAVDDCNNILYYISLSNVNILHLNYTYSFYPLNQ